MTQRAIRGSFLAHPATRLPALGRQFSLCSESACHRIACGPRCENDLSRVRRVKAKAVPQSQHEPGYDGRDLRDGDHEEDGEAPRGQDRSRHRHDVMQLACN